MLGRTNTFRRRRKADKEAGQAQIEFALSILTFLFLIFCCFELLMGIYTISVLGDAAKEGVRAAIVKGSSGSATCGGSSSTNPCNNDPFGVKSTVTGFAQLSLHDVSAMTVNVTYPDNNNDPGSRVQVSISYQYVPYINLSFFRPTLTASSEGRIVF